MLDPIKGYHQCPLDENSQLSSHHMADLNIFMPLMESHPSLNTTTTVWLKHPQGSLDFGTSLTILSSMTVIPNDTQPMFEILTTLCRHSFWFGQSAHIQY